MCAASLAAASLFLAQLRAVGLSVDDANLRGTVPEPFEPEITPQVEDSVCSYADVCELEKAKEYERAFSLYEARKGECGEAGWEVIKTLGQGMSGRARLMKTPCGMIVAAKEPPPNGTGIEKNQEMLRRHIEVRARGVK